MRPAISIIGTGKVGSTLARLLNRMGYRIVSLYNRTADTTGHLADITGASVANNPAETLSEADIVFLTVPDDAIEPVADSLTHLNWNDKAIVHTSGAKSLDILHSLARSGAMTASLHPAFPFADVDSAVENLPGASFALETSEAQLEQWLRDIVASLSGQIIMIPPGKKALYHASLVFVSNYTVSLYAIAQRLLNIEDSDSQAIDNALILLLQATVDNIRNRGIPDALTGPLTRSDTGTLQSHLDTLGDETLITAYIALARLSYPVLEQRGINTHRIEELLRGYNETTHNSQHTENER